LAAGFLNGLLCLDADFSVLLCLDADFSVLLCLEFAVIFVCLELAFKTYCVAAFVSYNTEIVPNPK
jgi:hypothetical protein